MWEWGTGVRYQIPGTLVARIRAFPILYHAYPVCGFFGTGTGNSVEVSAFHPGIRCQVLGTGYLVPGTWYRINAGDRGPALSTGKRAHGICILGVPHPDHRPTALLPYCPIALLPYCLLYCLMERG